MLVEGSSMRSISRIVNISINIVSAPLVDAGKACAKHMMKLCGVFGPSAFRPLKSGLLLCQG